MTFPNFLIYLMFVAYLVLAWRAFSRRGNALGRYRDFAFSLIPAFVLVGLAMTVGIRPLPDKRVVVHGYRLPLSERGIFIGSDDVGDDVRIHHRSREREWFSPGLLRVQPTESGNFQVFQSDPHSPNVVLIDGRPIRALPLQMGQSHRLTFAALNHRTDDNHSVLLTVDGNRPVFQFRGQKYKSGFVREGLGGWIYKPYRDGVLRHLAVGQRLPLTGLPLLGVDLLKQSAVFRWQGQWWLAANDADMRLDGEAFPTSALVNSGSWLSFVSRQLGGGRKTYRFRISSSQKKERLVYLAFEEDERPVFPLAKGETGDRICLASGESHFSDTIDIIDPQFPNGGTVIHQEGGNFVFRGQVMAYDTLYSAGQAVFSIDKLSAARMRVMAAFAWLFLLGFALIPPGLIRREPLIGLVLSGAFFLLAFRQVLAFRAWQGPPFKVSVLFDSLTAPYFFILLVLALCTRFQFWTLLQWSFGKIHNFLLPGSRRPLPRFRAGYGGTYFFGLVIYGLLVYSLLPDAIGLQFPGLVLMAVVLAVGVNSLGLLETKLSLHAVAAPGLARWRPILWLLPLFAVLILLAPMFGSREVIAVLPGRPRPDIFIQIFLMVTAAYFASIWEREAALRVPRPWIILLTFAAALLIPLLQGVISRDMGFFLMATPPLALVLVLATWRLDPRLRALMAVGILGFVFGIFLVKLALINLDQLPMRRVAFFIDPQRLKAEYFFEYLAHLPILWVGDQGFFGGGFFLGDWYPALAETAVNDNVASVFIQGELGGLGTVLTMAVFLSIAVAMLVFLAENRAARGFRVWFLLAVVLTLVWTAATMFLANLGVFPLTGKNLPFLGLDSLNDVVRYGLLFGFGIRYMDALKER